MVVVVENISMKRYLKTAGPGRLGSRLNKSAGLIFMIWH